MTEKPRPCPACRATMEQRAFARASVGELALDLCWDCHGIWFDPFESTQLAPDAVVGLFRLIHEHRDRPTRPLADSMRCPACEKRLVFTQDLQRSNRIAYYRCADGHGRFTTFHQFLREKQFVRSLTAPEIEKLRATVKQVRCSGCGAPVNLEKDSACPYCRQPVSILDADAVEKALAGYAAADGARPRAPDYERVAEAILARERKPPRANPWTQDVQPSLASIALADLVLEGISALFD